MSSAPSNPLISIVIPTRDRPDFAALALESLRNQSFRDFEAILSDNALHRHFPTDPRLFDGVRFRYVRPPRPVWMTDHYEFAVSQARGRYVGILGDKSLLVRSALAQVAAEIQKDCPDAVSWRTGGFQPSGRDLAGPGIVTVKRPPLANVVKVPAAEALEYMLATYLEPGFEADHQLETRGSIYHGVFSAELIRAIKARFGRVFSFYAPDLNAQCVAMQVAKGITHINRGLELVTAGPSNGVAVGVKVSQLMTTQEEAARGASGASAKLIPGLSASIFHLLASDLAALSGRQLQPAQWIELHRKAAFDLYRIEEWPDRSFKRSQLLALRKSLLRFGPELRHQVTQEKWNARKSKARTRLAEYVRKRFGSSVDRFRVVARQDKLVDKRSVEHLSAALAGSEL